MHTYRNSKNGGQGNQISSDMPIAKGTMIGSPRIHNRIYIFEGAIAGQNRSKPGSWPSGIGPNVQLVMYVIRQFLRISLCYLKNRSQSISYINSGYGQRHTALGG